MLLSKIANHSLFSLLLHSFVGLLVTELLEKPIAPKPQRQAPAQQIRLMKYFLLIGSI